MSIFYEDSIDIEGMNQKQETGDFQTPNCPTKYNDDDEFENDYNHVGDNNENSGAASEPFSAEEGTVMEFTSIFHEASILAETKTSAEVAKARTYKALRNDHKEQIENEKKQKAAEKDAEKNIQKESTFLDSIELI